MPDSTNNSKSKPSLEQLLHVKRAERPSPSFWTGFDQEFRRRQLVALVSKQPWHVRLGKITLVGLRKTAPAAAVVVAVALGFSVYNEQTSRPVNQSPAPEVAVVTSEPAFIVLPEEQFASNLDQVSVPSVASDARDQPRFATLELSSSVTQSRSFTTVTSPFAFAAAASDAGVYVVNDLTTGPVMRTPTSPVGSF